MPRSKTVAEVREALDFRQAGQTLTPIERAFIERGIAACDNHDKMTALYREGGVEWYWVEQAKNTLAVIADVLCLAGCLSE